MVSQFEDLQACYLKLRKQGPGDGVAMNGRMANGNGIGSSIPTSGALVLSFLATTHHLSLLCEYQEGARNRSHAAMGSLIVSGVASSE